MIDMDDDMIGRIFIAIAIVTIIIIVGVVLSISYRPENYAAKQLGLGFANQTCIDKGMVLDRVYSENWENHIVCKNVSMSKRIDGTSFIID